MKLMPEILRDVYDYHTLMVGKWYGNPCERVSTTIQTK